MKRIVSCLCALMILTISCQQEGFNDAEFEYEIDKGLIRVTGPELTWFIEPIRSDIVKASFAYHHQSMDQENSFFVIMQKEKTRFKVREFNDKLRVEAGDITVEITKRPFLISYLKQDDAPFLKSVELPLDSSGCKSMKFESPESEAFYGMGQKSIPVNRRGYAFDTRNYHVGGYSKAYSTMQVNIPYIYSSKKYGVFFDNTYTGYFDLAKSDSAAWSYRTDGGNYTFYVTTGESLQNLQNDYYDLTGYPTLPPKWILGLLQSKCGYENEAHVMDVVSKFDLHNLPLDAIILDAFWFGGYGEAYPQLMGNFTWLKGHFPDPAGYMARLKTRGIKTLTINEPQINVHSENHAMLMDRDWLMKVDNKPYIQDSFWAGSASLLDLTRPEVRAWLWQKQKANVDLGLNAFWVDLTEPDVSTPQGQFAGGGEPEIHNLYSYLFAQTLWDGFQADFPNRRLYNLTRAGTAGMHRMGAFHWSGDAAKNFAALKYQIPMLIGCAMSGMPHYSSDIGGFTNNWDSITVPWTEYKGGPGVTSPELYTRWFQFGVFSPLLRPHSGENQSCEPFAFDEQTLEITKQYLELRYQLIPYLYTYAYRTSSAGEQLIKPLFMVYDDASLSGRDYEYLFGDLLIAPVYEAGQRQREVYLPRLEKNAPWIGFSNHQIYQSGQHHIVDAPLACIPVFIPGSAIIPLGKIKKYTDETPDDTLTLRIYAFDHAEFTLYEDDGISKDFQNGAFARTWIEAASTEEGIEVTVHPMQGQYQGAVKMRTWHFEIYCSEPKQMRLNGKTIASANYCYDAVRRVVKLTVHQSTHQSIEIFLQS